MDRLDFYRTSWVAEALLKQFYRRYVTLRFDFGLARHYKQSELDLIKINRTRLWRALENPHFEIHSFTGHENNPTDLSYFLKRQVIEFIPEVSTVFDLNRTDVVIIDLDPKDPDLFSFEDTRQATAVILESVINRHAPIQKLGVEAYKLRFSGNRSFHIYVKLSKLYKFEEIRTELKGSLDVAVKMYPRWLSYVHLKDSNDQPRKDYMFVDIGALSRHRCVRSLWSIHHKTQLACVPVEDLMSFNRDEASIEAVLERGPRDEVF